MKRVMSLFLVLSLVLGIVIQQPVFAVVDSKAPELKSVTVNSKTLKAGEEVQITITAEDDVSGLKFASIDLASAVTNKTELLTGREVSPGKIVIKRIIKSTDNSGEWKINSLTLFDNANNTRTYNYDNILAGGNFVVDGNQVDSQAPVLKNVTVNSKTLKAGEEVQITITAEDDESGLKFASIDLASAVTNKTELLTGREVSPGKIVIKRTIKSTDNSGEWKINSLTLFDNANNTRTYNYDNILAGGNFVVDGNQVDSQAPVLKNVTVNNKTVKAGEEVQITITAEDDVSGLKFASIDLASAVTNKTELLTGREVSPGKIVIKRTMKSTDNSGEWKINSLTLFDNANNTVTINDSSILSGGTFVVTNVNENKVIENASTEPSTIEIPSSEAPLDTTKLLKSINVNNQSLKEGDKVKFTAEVLDDSRAKISKIMLNYVDYEKSDLMYLDLYPIDKDTLILESEINDQFKAGKWKVTDITVFYNNGEIQNFFNTKAEFGTKYQPYADYSNIDLTIEKSNKPPFLPKGILYSNSDYERKLHDIKIVSGNKTIYNDSYIAYKSTDQAIKEAMSKISSSIYYYDHVDVSKGYTIFTNGQISFAGTSSDITIYVKSYQDLNKPIEIVTTERPTTERPTTERPTTERPTTERPTTEVPTAEVPTTESITTEQPTTEDLKVIKVAKPVISNKYIGDSSTVITGKGKSYSYIYAVANKKVIGKAKVVKGKFSMKIAKQKSGTKVTLYANYKNTLSDNVLFTVVDKTAPSYPTINKVTYKSKLLTGKGEKSAKVYVYNGKKKLGFATIDSKGNYKVKITPQKKYSILTVYLVDKAGNKGKSKTIKVS